MNFLYCFLDLLHKQDLLRFFTEVVDETCNLLVAAVATYVKTERFEVGCKMFAVFWRKNHQTTLRFAEKTGTGTVLTCFTNRSSEN